MGRSRSFTITMWDEHQCDAFISAIQGCHPTYYVIGKERCPDTGATHYHGYVHFYNARSWQALHDDIALELGSRYVGRKSAECIDLTDDRAPSVCDENKGDGSLGFHLEEVRHNGKAIAYCKKDGVVTHEHGLPPNQGKRTDVIRMMEAVEGGASDFELFHEHTSGMCRYYRAAREYRRCKIREESRGVFTDTFVLVLYGGTGLGKTRWCFDNFPDLYRLQNDGNGALWFDGYEQQRQLLLDDFRGWIPYDFLLHLLDGYPMRLPVKGSFATRCYDTVLITSNDPPGDWYASRGLTPELSRRLSRVVHVERKEDLLLEF